MLEQLLSSRRLNSAASGGLGSYALVLMATALLHREASSQSGAAWGGVGPLLVRFLDHFAGTSRDALHAVVLDSESRLQAKQLTRIKLLSEEKRSNALHAHGGHTHASSGADGHTDDPYEEAVYAASLLVQDPISSQFANVSDSAFRWNHVQAVFRDALQRLQRALRLEERAPGKNDAEGAHGSGDRPAGNECPELLAALLEAPPTALWGEAEG